MNAALHLESLKFRRATVSRLATALVVVLAPALSAVFLVVARTGGDSALALKIAPLLQDDGWRGLTGIAAQILSVGGLLAFGFVVAWVFGREFTEKTFGALFASPTPRAAIAAAKLAVVGAWGAAVSLAVAVFTLVAGVASGLGAPDAAAWAGVIRIAVVGWLTVLLALPLGLVASVTRGYLGAFAALLGIVLVTQIVVALGAGAWFPYAAPGIWAGLGGGAQADAVTAVQLLLAVPVGIVGGWAALLWWRTASIST